MGDALGGRPPRFQRYQQRRSWLRPGDSHAAFVRNVSLPYDANTMNPPLETAHDCRRDAVLASIDDHGCTRWFRSNQQTALNRDRDGRLGLRGRLRG